MAFYQLTALSTIELKILKKKKNGELRVVRGRILNPISDTGCELFGDGMIVGRRVSEEWLIESCGDSTEIAAQYGWDLESIPANEGTILPPFFDSHFHWVQDDVREMPKTSLLEWLERYTFPEEARFSDPDYSEVKASYFWKRILATGTIGGFCYSSIHTTALDAAMKHAPETFRIGGALMTMNCPGFLRQTSDEAIEAVAEGAQKYGERYCVTPRFAPTTHPSVMSVAAKLAEGANLYQQTHLDETRNEIDWVLGIYSEIDGFEDVETYTEIYNRCGVLGPKTIMGHAIHLDESELELLAKSDTAIASCPTSNGPVSEYGLGSGLFNFEQAEAYGIRWALASDIGGGPFLSMFDVMRSFVQQNKRAKVATATYTKALFRSTVAGAQLIGYADKKGNFAPGKAFDFIQCIDPPELPEDLTPEALLSSTIEQISHREEFDEFVLATVIDGSLVFQRKAMTA